MGGQPGASGTGALSPFGRLPSGVVWREGAVEDPADAAARRLAEHAAGRRAAAEALALIGFRGRPVGRAPNGAPRFPAGFAGSITHDGGLAAAAVASSASGFGAVGIDLHRVRPLAGREARYIATEAELAAAATACGDVAVHVLFALKEAVFKAVSAADGRWLEFADIELEVHSGAAARLIRPGDDAVLRWHIGGGRIRTIALLR